MSRALHRGLSTAERIRPPLPAQQEEDSEFKDRNEQGIEERSRNRPIWEAFCPHFIRLWIKQNFSYSFPAHKTGVKSLEIGTKSWKCSGSPGRPPGINSLLVSNTGFSSNRFSCLSCYGKPNAFLFLPTFLFCLIVVFMLIAIVGWNRHPPRVVFPPYNYHRAQLFAWRDLLRGGILGRGSLVSEPREVAVCRSGMEDYVPCHNMTVNLDARYADGTEFEPHCELMSKILCLVPPPQNYRILEKWPRSSEGIWRWNLQIDEAMGRNRFIFEKDELKFPADDQQLGKDVGSHVQEIAEILGLSGVQDFSPAKIRTVLDIGCGVGTLGVHLWEYEILTMCIAPYEEHGAQVQIALERGVPAMIGSMMVTQLPFPSSSFDLIHCANCAVEGNSENGMSLLEIDRLLRSGGHFVWIIPSKVGPRLDAIMVKMHNFTSSVGWEMVSPSQPGMLMIWQKKVLDIDSTLQHVTLLCDRGRYNVDWAWHEPLRPCITVPPGYRQVSVQGQLGWPSRLQLAATEALKSGPAHDEITGERHSWSATVADYWSLLTPDIFSDHPKRVKDGDSGPKAHLVRNMMDMNAGHGALNAALLMSGKQVWVMNVIPTSASNTLPYVYDRGLIGTVHDWCEPFPSYPRTYDFLHAAGLLSQELKRRDPCGLANLFLEMDRILRPEGWVFLRDRLALIEDARVVTNQMRWESRMIEIVGDTEQRLLVCQKTFWKS